jgi:hypothetical protein
MLVYNAKSNLPSLIIKPSPRQKKELEPRAFLITVYII